MTTNVIISQLPPPPNGTGTGSSKGTDLFPATDVTDTSTATTGTTKKYTLSEIYNFILNAEGLTTYAAVRVATTTALSVVYANGVSGVGATLTNSGVQVALSIDGVALSIGDRVLVKNQVSQLQNGIYTVTNIGSSATNWIMTRATDYDTTAEIVQFGVVLSNQGTLNAGKLWQEVGAGPFSIGSTAIIFAAYTAQSLSFPVLLSEGGTSASLVANNGGIFYSTASAGAILAGTATAGQLLQSGSSSAPNWTTATYPSVATSTGTILRANGTNWVHSTATFADTYAVSTILYAGTSNAVSGLSTVNRAALSTNATGVPTWLALTDGQVVIGSTAGAPAGATLTAGVGVTITSASNAITISAEASGLTWSTISGTSQAAAVDNGYIVGNAGQTTITLPALFNIGEVVVIKGLGAAGWILAANTGQTIQLGQSATTSGGSLTSAGNFDTVYVTGIVTNLTWSVDYALSTGLTIA